MGMGAYERDEELMGAWSAFCDQLSRAGERIFKEENGSTEIDRCSGFRYLTQNLSQAFDIWLENRDTRFPFLHPFCSPIRKLGADNADCIYYQSWINDVDTYRISGTRGSARMFNIALQGPWLGALHEPFGDSPISNVFGDDLELDEAGRFVLWVSPQHHAGNWLKSEPGSRKIFYRQYFDGWEEEPASFRIERVGAPMTTDPMSTDRLIEAMQVAGKFVFAVVDDWPDSLWPAHKLDTYVNEFPPREIDEDPNSSWSEGVDSRRGRVVHDMRWELAPDEAMVIEFDPADSFWQLTNMNVFGASMDFRCHQVNLTSATAEKDADGYTRLIMSHADPGFANWIDTEKHSRGWLLFRNVLTRSLPNFETKVVRQDDLDIQLAGRARIVSAAERAAMLKERLDAYARRFPTLGV